MSEVAAAEAAAPGAGRDAGAGAEVLRCGELAAADLERLLGRYGLALAWVADGEPIPGSYWGPPEAGLRAAGDATTVCATTVWVRRDTPVHSLLHEACHAVCMSPERRAALDTEAGGDDAEENAVCYLQILLAAHLEGVGAARLIADMDAWGYTFRLGSARAWFERDAQDARAWLLERALIDEQGQPTWRLRSTAHTKTSTRLTG